MLPSNAGSGALRNACGRCLTNPDGGRAANANFIIVCDHAGKPLQTVAKEPERVTETQ
jgi:hypothetical protein